MLLEPSLTVLDLAKVVLAAIDGLSLLKSKRKFEPSRVLTKPLVKLNRTSSMPMIARSKP